MKKITENNTHEKTLENLNNMKYLLYKILFVLIERDSNKESES